MPIAHDVTGYATSAGSATATVDVTVASTADRYAVISFGSVDGGGAATHSSADLESEGATQVGTDQTQFFGLLRKTAWRRINPGAGSGRTLTLTAADSEDVGIHGSVSVYNGVDQTTYTRDNDQTNGSGFGGTGANTSHTLTTVAGDLVQMTISIWAPDGGTVTLSSTDADASRSNTTSQKTTIVLEKTATGTSTSIGTTWSHASSNHGWCADSVAIIQATSSGRTADAAITLGAVTSSSAATVALAAAATPTLGALTSSSAATLALRASADITLGAATLSSASTLLVEADAAITLGALTVESASTLTDGRTAAADITLGAATLSSAGTVALAGAAAITLDALTSSSQGALAIDADLAVTLGAVTLESESIIVSGRIGAADITLDALTAAAEGELGPAVSAPVQGPGFFAGGYYEPIKKAEPKAPRLRAPRQAAKKSRAVEPLPAMAASASIELGAMTASITARSSLFLVNGVQRTKPPLARSPSLESRVASLERALARITQSKEL